MSDIPSPTSGSTLTATYCANHPTVETSLRCNRCEKLICPKCAVATPTGYRCKECISGQQKIFETSRWIDYPIAFFLALIFTGITSFFVSFLGFFAFLLAPAAGVLIAEIVRFGIRKRRSRNVFLTAAGGAVLAGLPLLIIAVFSLEIFSIIIQVYFIAVVPTTIYQALRGISIR